MCKRYLSCFKCALFTVFFSTSTFGLDEERLWLPKSYETLYLELKASAEAALKLERCVKVLRGTIDRQQSTKDHPVFRIQCRQPNGRTYNELVDGLTKETLTTPVIIEVPPTEEELAAMRAEEERKKKEAADQREREFLQACKTQFDSKTRVFENIELLNPKPEPSSFSMEAAAFMFDFDTRDINGTPLKYRAYCSVALEEEARIKIRKRRD